MITGVGYLFGHLSAAAHDICNLLGKTRVGHCAGEDGAASKHR
jgi:hypothetical protein